MSASEEVKTQDAIVPEEKQDEFIKKLEEDDEFEDFPEDDWEDVQSIGANHETSLWEESWEDHDDYKDDFTNRLRAELQKSSAAGTSSV